MVSTKQVELINNKENYFCLLIPYIMTGVLISELISKSPKFCIFITKMLLLLTTFKGV